MTETELKSILSNLSIWKKNEQRAPHKPLLLLLALSGVQRNQSELPYEEVKPKLKSLLFEFGPARKSYHPEEPFVRLMNDGIWQLNKPVDKRQPSDKKLLAESIGGGFNPEVISLLKGSPLLVQEVAQQLLDDHFPETMHEDIAEAVGLQLTGGSRKLRRDPEFRNRVLRAYESCCAICGFNVRLGNQLVGVDAAHIQWHQAGGPDSEENGIALCVLHHKLFDRGVFTITGDREMLVAEDASGTNGLDEWLMRYHGKRIRQPIRPTYLPQAQFTDWHVREVFRGPARYTV